MNIPLRYSAPSPKRVRSLMKCFHIDPSNVYRTIQKERRGAEKSEFYVMASKFLHFLRPDVFAPMDSNSRKFFFGKEYEKYNSPSGYMEMLTILNQILNGKWGSIDLKALREVDGEHYHGDIKMIDKIAYTLGKKWPAVNLRPSV